MRLPDYLDTLSWSQTDLAREAGISASTIRRVLSEKPISRRNAHAITDALSRGLKRPIVLADVSELHITGLKRPRKTQAEK